MWQQAAQLAQDGCPFVVVTLIEIKGSAPSDIGAKIIISAEAIEFGSVGGGKLEAQVISIAREMLSASTLPKAKLKRWNLQKDIGMSCGGEVTLIFEIFAPPAWEIVVFGAGHVAIALIALLSKLHCRLRVIDDRSEWLDKITGAEKIKLAAPQQYVAQCNDKTFFISVTKGHACDLPVVFEIFKNFPSAPYIGVIGSKAKGLVLKNELAQRGVTTEFLNRIRLPIGQPIGSNDPQEIAVSIAAELLQVRDKNRAYST